MAYIKLQTDTAKYLSNVRTIPAEAKHIENIPGKAFMFTCAQIED